MVNDGPWTYKDDLVLVAECSSLENLNESLLQHAEVWVQFHNVPLESLTEEGFSIITNKVGVALSDPKTAYHNGKPFQRVKMLVALNRLLEDHVMVRHPVLGVVKVYLVFERLGRICLFCGDLGHDIGSCTERARLIKIKKRMEGRNRPELEGILKPTRGVWINNQAMVPLKGRQLENVDTGPKPNPK